MDDAENEDILEELVLTADVYFLNSDCQQTLPDTKFLRVDDQPVD